MAMEIYKSMSERYRGGRLRHLLLFGFFVLCVSFASLDGFAAIESGNTIISRKDRLELTDIYTNTVLQKVRGELRLNGILDREPSVTVQLEFDEKKLAADAATWIVTEQERLKQSETKQNSDLKQSIKDLIATAVAERTPKKPSEIDQAKASGTGLPRLGRLNVDITDATISEVIRRSDELEASRAPEASSPITLAINMPSPSGASLNPFIFNAADYISKLSVAVILPATTPNQIESGLKAAIENVLDLKSIAKGQATQDWIQITKAPLLPPQPSLEPLPTAKTYLQNIWRPENLFVGILTTGLVVGMFVLMSMFIAASMISKGLKSAFVTLGKDIASLKPPEEKEESESTDVNEGEDEDEEVEEKYDATATSQALTHEMATIRDQVRALVVDQAFLSAEYLRDMLYSDSGLADFKDFLSFIGYSPLKPALDLLPQSAIERLQTFIEESRDNPPNLLNGTEIAQRVYSECVSKATLTTEAAKALDPVRAELIKTEDVAVAKFLSEADSTEIALLLRTLTVERGNRLMKGLSAAKLKAAASDLDKPLSDQDQVIAAVISKLRNISSSLVEKSQSQRKLILRLAKSVSVADEDIVYELVPPEDWDLKRQIIRQRIFLKDAIYVPAKILSAAFGSLPLATRCAVMIVASDELKKSIMATMQSGSKKAEILQTEIEQTKKNAKKLELIQSTKDKYLEAMATATRKFVTGDLAVVDQIMLAQAKALNIEPPAELKAKMSASGVDVGSEEAA